MPSTKYSPNHLINEKSPYLLQHAHNPVDWNPWGEEAFAKAKAEDKPIFLSIGYSTCHWCHVMERESFEDEEVAQVLNGGFVPVKVDREERPDVDGIYMTVCQALTGSGGWPLTVLMTPDRKPFFAGTYFPKRSRGGRPGLLDILAAVDKEWQGDRIDLMAGSEQITDAIGKAAAPRPGKLSRDMLDTAYSQLARVFDATYGGFGQAPKFPTPHNMLFLLRYWRLTGQPKALSMVTKTLEAMHQGGIYDHLGFGFARYSVDERWHVPHFEKMLYDNALLCYTLLEAYQCAGNPEFAQVAEEIADYVLRDMTDAGGGFYSAEDADSEGEEGKFYVWTRAEVLASLGDEPGRLFADYYNITPEGNFESATSIPHHIGYHLPEYAARHGIDAGALSLSLAAGREKLYAIREKRVHPFKDDKVLTAWNALMIAALAKAARVLDKPAYAAAAAQAAEFVFARLRRPDGRLLARYRDGQAAFPAYLDDHAFLLWALVELYEATFDSAWLDKARRLAGEMQALFWDDKHDGFYFSGSDSEELIARPKEIYDGALPAGNSVAGYALLKLARILDNAPLLDLAERTLQAFAGQVAAYPQGHTFFLMAVDQYLEPPRQLVIAGRGGDPATRAMLRVAGTQYLPTTTVIFNNTAAESAGEALAWTKDYQPVAGQTAAYVCENFACQAPTTTTAALIELLRPHRGRGPG